VPVAGATHEVKMIGDATGYRFEPAAITVKAGDAIKWTMVSGGPHNVDFSATANAAAKSQIDANMSGTKMGPASSQMVMQPNETITVSFANVPAGTYEYICTPHAAMNMKGSVTVQ
jgi:plastocyanin